MTPREQSEAEHAAFCEAFLGFKITEGGLCLKVCTSCAGARRVRRLASEGRYQNRVIDSMCGRHAFERNERLTP